MTTDFLSKIIDSKRTALESAREAVCFEQLREEAISVRRKCVPHALIQTLSNERINVIAEFKRKSPSKGLIRNDLSPQQMARYYESGGAAAISVLTEENYFGGSLDDLRAIRATVSIPVLRKDFLFDDYQIYESAASGADAVLLIVAALDDASLIRLRRLAEDELRMDALVEIHTKNEMRRAIASGANFIGINNRNLKTFDVSMETSRKLAGETAGEAILIAESGLNSFDDLIELRRLGYRGFLIGEKLMRATRPDIELQALLGKKTNGETG